MSTIKVRQIEVEIQFDDGSRIYKSPMDIKITGSKNITALQNICTVEISNLKKEERDYILANCNQNLAAQYKVRRIKVSAGRDGSGSWQVFIGDIINAALTQPPDITLVLRCATNARDRTNWEAMSNTGQLPLSKLITDVCGLLLLTPQVDDSVDQTKMISRFQFLGPLPALVIALQEAAHVRAFVDDDKLVVTSWNVPLANSKVDVNKNTGMIGIPEFTEYGIRVKVLADKRIVLGGAITLNSVMVPVMNADYVITRLDYNLTSRSTPFYYDVWASRSA